MFGQLPQQVELAAPHGFDESYLDCFLEEGKRLQSLPPRLLS